MKTLLKNAKILKMDDSPLFEGDLLIENNRIKKIDKNITDSADKVIDCEGNVIMPGFVDAHAHGPMTFMRSQGDNKNLSDWLTTEVFPREAKITPSDVYNCMKLAILEYIKGGITSSFEQYYFPLETAKAAKDMGFRVSLVGTWNAITSRPNLIEYYKTFNYDENSLINYQIGLHAEYTTSQEEVDMISSVCHELHAPFYCHISETQNEVDECYKRHGFSPIEFFLKNGCYDYGGGGFHCIYFSDKDIQIFKEHNLSIVTNPGSNLKLASGICPVQKYLDNGLNVAIGTDGPASNNSLDMFKEIYLASSVSKVLSKKPTSFPAYDLLKMATINGAKAMNLKDVGMLKEGYKADIIMIDMKNPAMQPVNSIIDNIVYSGSKDIIKMTMIDGVIKYYNGSFFINEDIESVYKTVNDIARRLDKEIGR